MIILISGAVGTGKTTIANLLGKKLNLEVVNLNEIAKDFKLKDVKELQTFDFDLDKLLTFVENKIKDHIEDGKDLILEGHFSHFIKPELIDYLFIINRDLIDLKSEYVQRKYNKKKIEDNLEVESFNLCFYEGVEEGYEEEKQIFCMENLDDINFIISKILKKIDKEI